MDLVPISIDRLFDTGPVPVDTSATWTRLARLPVRGRGALLSVQVGPQSIGGLRVRRGAVPDDANPVVVGDSAGLSTAPTQDVRFTLPTPLTFPLAAGSVVQVGLPGGAAELIVEARQAAAAGGWVRAYGTANRGFP